MMPGSVVRLSAGRSQMTDELQALCLHAGASSIFLGDRLLTTPNPGDDHDRELLERLDTELAVLDGVTPAVQEAGVTAVSVSAGSAVSTMSTIAVQTRSTSSSLDT
jgi:biotin synthase-like enzyme